MNLGLHAIIATNWQSSRPARESPMPSTSGRTLSGRFAWVGSIPGFTPVSGLWRMQEHATPKGGENNP